MSLLKKPKASFKRKLKPDEATVHHQLPSHTTLNATQTTTTTTTSSNTPNHSLLVDRHAPTYAADLATHPKKVDELRTWLRRADAALQLHLAPTPRMVVLTGPPGCGKSATLRVLASELGYELVEWLEGRSTRWRADADAREHADYEPRIDSFARFLVSSLRTVALNVVVRRAAEGAPAAALSAEPAAAAPAAAAVGVRRRLVLLEELPASAGGGGEHAGEQLARQQGLLRNALEKARFPIAFICNGEGGSAAVLERLFGRSGVEAAQPLVTFVAFNPVADTLLKAAVSNVAARERLGLGASELQAIVASAHGDLRHALNALQLWGMGRGLVSVPEKRLRGDAKKDRAKVTATSAPSEGRDVAKDLFHTIGKLLSIPAKRAKEGTATALTLSGGPARSPLTALPVAAAAGAAAPLAAATSFDPERLLELSTLDEATTLAFLQQNYLGYFGDTESVADTADDLSLAATLLHASRARQAGGRTLPVVGSICARAVVEHNRHPAPLRFNSIVRPQSHVAERIAAEARNRAIAAFCPPSDTSQAGRRSETRLSAAREGATTLATELLPHLALVVAASAHGAPRADLSRAQLESIAEVCHYGEQQLGHGGTHACAFKAAIAAAYATEAAVASVRGGQSAAGTVVDDVEEF